MGSPQGQSLESIIFFFLVSNETPKCRQFKEPPNVLKCMQIHQKLPESGAKLRRPGRTVPTPRALCPAPAATLVPVSHADLGEQGEERG